MLLVYSRWPLLRHHSAPVRTERSLKYRRPVSGLPRPAPWEHITRFVAMRVAFRDQETVHCPILKDLKSHMECCVHLWDGENGVWEIEVRCILLFLAAESLNPFRAPKPLPLIISSNLSQKRLFSCKGVKGLPTVYCRELSYS